MGRSSTAIKVNDTTGAWTGTRTRWAVLWPPCRFGQSPTGRTRGIAIQPVDPIAVHAADAVPEPVRSATADPRIDPSRAERGARHAIDDQVVVTSERSNHTRATVVLGWRGPGPGPDEGHCARAGKGRVHAWHPHPIRVQHHLERLTAQRAILGSQLALDEMGGAPLAAAVDAHGADHRVTRSRAREAQPDRAIRAVRRGTSRRPSRAAIPRHSV